MRLSRASEEVYPADKRSYGCHRKYDASHHDVCSWLGIPVHFAGLGRSCSTADRLDDKRDDVAGTEGPRVRSGTQERAFGAKGPDEAAEEDIDAGGEKCGCYSCQLWFS